jgi:hypothetical protein
MPLRFVRLPIAAVALLAFVIACETVPPPTDAAGNPAYVRVAATAPPSRDCENLGEVTGSATRMFTSLEDAMRNATARMQNAAAEMGADFVSKETVAQDRNEVVVSGTAYRCTGTQPAATAQPAALIGAAGFTFGESRAEAEQSCRASGHLWSATSAGLGVCNGAPIDTGLPGEVIVGFCGDGRVCDVAMAVIPKDRRSDGWLDGFTRIQRALRQKYGEPANRVANIPKECREDIAPCLDDARAAVEVTWQWRSGQRVALRMGKLDDGSGDVAIRLRYQDARGDVRPKAQGL